MIQLTGPAVCQGWPSGIRRRCPSFRSVARCSLPSTSNSESADIPSAWARWRALPAELPAMLDRTDRLHAALIIQVLVHDDAPSEARRSGTEAEVGPLLIDESWVA